MLFRKNALRRLTVKVDKLSDRRYGISTTIVPVHIALTFKHFVKLQKNPLDLSRLF